MSLPLLPTKPEYPELVARATQWFAGDWGQQVLARERLIVDEALSQCFGYYLLQMSIDPAVDLVAGSRVQRSYRCHPSVSDNQLRCEFEQLPFESESLDAVIVHHAHEFSDDPHGLLREVQRVVIPNGQIILVGFNALSPIGLYSLGHRLLPQSPWHNNSLTCGRLRDWLSLLGFETRQVWYGAHSPGWLDRTRRVRLQRWLERWPLGNIFVVSAVKQVAKMTPVKPRWRDAPKGFANLAPIKPGITGKAAMLEQHKPGRGRPAHEQRTEEVA